MPRPAPALGPGQRPGAPAEPHLVPLAGEWALWRDIAVRTAGFPVSGLGIFGSQNEQAGLRAVARDPLFQTAVTWQNRAAMRNAVGKIAGGSPAPRAGRPVHGPRACGAPPEPGPVHRAGVLREAEIRAAETRLTPPARTRSTRRETSTLGTGHGGHDFHHAQLAKRFARN